MATKITKDDIKKQQAEQAANGENVLAVQGEETPNIIALKGSESDSALFDNPNSGEAFGGSYPRIGMEVGDVSPRLVWAKDTKLPLKKKQTIVENGVKREEEITEIKTVHIAGLESDPAVLVGLPIGSVFERLWDEAGIRKGDVFLIKRLESVKKKAGVGAGQMMEVYALKVVFRATEKAVAGDNTAPLALGN